MANYIKIKRGKLTWRCLAIIVEENWILEEYKDIENGERRIRKLGREIKERFNKDNVLKGKKTRDCHLLLQPSKRLKNHLLCEGGFLE